MNSLRILMVSAHPFFDSFNQSLKEEVLKVLKSRGAEVQERDLYSPLFQPVLTMEDFDSVRTSGKPLQDVLDEQKMVSWANRLIFLYPIWWHDRPAVLKGWLDRVFTPGFAYEVKQGQIRGLLTHEKAYVIQTAGMPKKVLVETGALEIMQRSMTEGTLGFVGINKVDVVTLCAVGQVTQEEREKMIQEVIDLFLKW